MIEIKLIDGDLYQWDSGRKIEIVSKDETISEVHFSLINDKEALVVDPKETAGNLTADIPNILLQQSKGVSVYLVTVSVDREQTIRQKHFAVKKRPKPADYVYTETEVQSYSVLEKRLEYLEGEGLGKIISTYLKEHPIEAGATKAEAEQIAKNKTDIGALQKEKLAAAELPNAIDTALAQAKESGMFNGKDGQDGQDGQDGYTPQKGVDYFDGKDGENGADGYTPVKGTDYFTEADKQEIIAEIFNQVTDGSEVSY